jgi:chitin disaccharide deacetylase
VPHPLRLVITADDLGMDPWRDAGIFAAYLAGAITQASLVVAGATARPAAERALRIGLPIGLHLDLTEAAASAPRQEISSLLDARGAKLGKHGLRAAIARGQVDPAHIAREAGAQLEAFARMTRGPARHVDGHQHIHVLPDVATVLAPLFAAAGVRSTRIPEQWDLSFEDPYAAPFYRRVSADAGEVRPLYAGFGIRSTEGFAGLDLMGTSMTPDRLGETVRRAARFASLELMCHPGLAGQAGDAFTRSPAREHELQVLCRQPFSSRLHSKRIQLATFAELAPGAGLL